jgi:hypothetical protein
MQVRVVEGVPATHAWGRIRGCNNVCPPVPKEGPRQILSV